MVPSPKAQVSSPLVELHSERARLRFEPLLRFKSVDRWLRRKELGTRWTYLQRFERFLTYAKMRIGVSDPDEFLAWAETQKGLVIQDLIDEFADKQPLSTQANYMGTVRSFLKKNGVTSLPALDKWSMSTTHREGYTRKQIQTLLEYLPKKRHKAYVLFAKDSGLRAAHTLSVQYHHIKKDLEAGRDFVHIAFEPVFYNRKKAAGLTFIGPNALKVLKELIAEGEIKTEDKSPIFPFSYTALTDALILAKKKANLPKLIQPSHGLRKYFENCLDRLGGDGELDYHKKLQLEGHSQGVRIHYTSQETEELRLLYQKAYRYLDLSEEAAADSRFQDLDKELAKKTQHIEALKEEISKLREEKPEIPKGLVEELAAMRKRLEELERKK